MHSIYAGFENGAWLQVWGISDLTAEQTRAPTGACHCRDRDQLVRPTAGGELPLRRLIRKAWCD